MQRKLIVKKAKSWKSNDEKDGDKQKKQE